jgi:hypothetical protein
MIYNYPEFLIFNYLYNHSCVELWILKILLKNLNANQSSWSNCVGFIRLDGLKRIANLYPNLLDYQSTILSKVLQPSDEFYQSLDQLMLTQDTIDNINQLKSYIRSY